MLLILKRILFSLLLLPSLTQAKALCPQSVSSIEIEQCLTVKLEQAVNELENNLDLIRIRYAEDPILLKLFEQSQLNWEAYRRKHCQSVFQLYHDASTQSLMTVSCAIELARQRNSLLRNTYLSGR